MRIGIDISQLAYGNTGVANYLQKLVHALLEENKGNEYILFYSSFRTPLDTSQFTQLDKNVVIKQFRLPPRVLALLWNRLHILPIEKFIGDVDIFISSDWTEPPAKKAKKTTVIYDMIVYKHPEETDSRIIQTQKRKLHWVKKETETIFAISEATKRDIMQILHIPEKQISVVYPGL